MSHLPDPGGPADRPRLLCAYCGRTEVPAGATPARLPVNWWPRCCGQVMVYLGIDNPEPADRTDPEVPSLAAWADGLNPRPTPQLSPPTARRSDRSAF
jgi:hypothetical protein